MTKARAKSTLSMCHSFSSLRGLAEPHIAWMTIAASTVSGSHWNAGARNARVRAAPCRRGRGSTSGSWPGGIAADDLERLRSRHAAQQTAIEVSGNAVGAELLVAVELIVRLLRNGPDAPQPSANRRVRQHGAGSEEGAPRRRVDPDGSPSDADLRDLGDQVEVGVEHRHDHRRHHHRGQRRGELSG